LSAISLEILFLESDAYPVSLNLDDPTVADHAIIFSYQPKAIWKLKSNAGHTGKITAVTSRRWVVGRQRQGLNPASLSFIEAASPPRDLQRRH
jgi:hypothetical protein